MGLIREHRGLLQGQAPRLTLADTMLPATRYLRDLSAETCLAATQLAAPTTAYARPTGVEGSKRRATRQATRADEDRQEVLL